MEMRPLGVNGPFVSAIGLGCMGMSDYYGFADEAESIRTIHRAIDQGITLLDTGDFYGMGDNEMLIARAIQGHRDKLFIQVKFGALRTPDRKWSGFDARPAAVKNFLAYSLKRLGTDYVDLYQPARVDATVPIEDTVGAIADMVKAGYVRHIGLSEAGAATIRKANAVHPIAGLQIEYSLFSRSIEKSILPATRELGIGITAYGVLSRGLLSGKWTAESSRSGDFRSFSPRFSGENSTRNLRLVEVLRNFAAERNATPGQMAIAWVLAQGRDIIPLIGSRTVWQLEESLKALEISLDPGEFDLLARAVPAEEVAGGRYPEEHLRHLDSER